jgi:F-type H+-transporting ATPase subunit b
MSQEVQLAAEAIQTSESVGGLGTLGINLKIFIAQLINFTVVLLVLWRLAYRPIVQLLEDRQEKIERGVKQAEEVEKRVADLERERSEVIAKATLEAARMLEDARMSAEHRKTELLTKAKEEVRGVVAQGKAQLEAQKVQMMVEAREELAALAVEAAGKILQDGVDEKKAMKLAQDVIASKQNEL